jgi:hypothetical protein
MFPLLCDAMVHCDVHMGWSLVIVLSQTNPAHVLTHRRHTDGLFIKTYSKRKDKTHPYI